MSPAAFMDRGGRTSITDARTPRKMPGHTGNVMRNTRLPNRCTLDETLNTIGGEDVVFFRALRATDSTSNVRLARWLTNRYLAAARPQVMMRRCIARGRHKRSASGRRYCWLAQSNRNAARVRPYRRGLVLVVVTAATRGRRLSSSRPLNFERCRGVGMLIAAFGFAYQEYGQGYRRDK